MLSSWDGVSGRLRAGRRQVADQATEDVLARVSCIGARQQKDVLAGVADNS